ncbi:MAG: hypothetical protein ACYC0X_03260 [Pirellulaceae bacterium]
MTFTPLRCWLPGVLIFSLGAVAAGPAFSADPLGTLHSILKYPARRPLAPATSCDTAVETLAREIDWLEHHVNRWGTVTAKVPDVWGEARLMKHRQEYEDIVARELAAFEKGRISGVQFIQDQAFLAAALAMQASLAGQGGTPPAISSTVQVDSDPGTTGSPAVTAGTQATNIRLDFAGPLTNTPILTPGAGGRLEFPSNVQVEQTEILDQLSRYLNHLNELRRINEGDDTADSPGYSLHLVRIPVSILPGEQTRRGWGAEITVTAEPYLGPELLPMAFRDLVINDVIDQLALPLASFLNGDRLDVARAMKELDKYEDLLGKLTALNQRWAINPCIMEVSEEVEPALACLKLEFFVVEQKVLRYRGIVISTDNVQQLASELEEIQGALEKYIQQVREKKSQLKAALGNVPTGARIPEDTLRLFQQLHAPLAPSAQPSAEPGTLPRVTREDLDDAVKSEHTISALEKANSTLTDVVKESNVKGLLDSVIQLTHDLEGLRRAVTVIHIPGSVTRKATLPFPPTQLIDNYGVHELGHVAKGVYNAFRADLVNRHVAHATDIAAFLREELAAAYELMSTDTMQVWWQAESTGERCLYGLVRQRQLEEIKAYRDRFISSMPAKAQHSSTASLAWCVFVESLLLNERLIRDMQETAGNRGCACLPEGWFPFFGPNPPEEARLLFTEYVRCRWPVHVFALDPVVNEQNIQETSSIYREMQLAVALGFASGQIGTQGAMQAMRRLQRDTATIDLNRMIVGFGHGDDTFGWRFYPRFQTPPVEGNFTVFFRDTLLGGPTDESLLGTQKIEPGMRECLAMVVMPSFVPYVRFDTRANWFKLRSPGHTAVSMADTVHFSRSIRAMQTAAQQCVVFAGAYRDGEVERLLKRVHQLDRKLPLQTLNAQVPYENSLGGFEMFSSGTSELAPELLGWYGAPGVRLSEPTVLFLAGDNFSVHQTRLVVGTQEVPFRVLSRQIMQVTLPAGLRYMEDENLRKDELYEGYVDAHLATPYGTSSHLLIPVLREQDFAFLNRIRISSPGITLDYTLLKSGGVRFDGPGREMGHVSLRVDVPPGVGFGDRLTEVRFYPRQNSVWLRAFAIGEGTASVGVRVDPTGYLITGSDFADLIDNSANTNDLSGAVTHYLQFLATAKSLAPGDLEVLMTASVEHAAQHLNAVGDIFVRIRIQPEE